MKRLRALLRRKKRAEKPSIGLQQVVTPQPEYTAGPPFFNPAENAGAASRYVSTRGAVRPPLGPSEPLDPSWPTSDACKALTEAFAGSERRVRLWLDSEPSPDATWDVLAEVMKYRAGEISARELRARLLARYTRENP